MNCMKSGNCLTYFASKRHKTVEILKYQIQFTLVKARNIVQATSSSVVQCLSLSGMLESGAKHKEIWGESTPPNFENLLFCKAKTVV